MKHLSTLLLCACLIALSACGGDASSGPPEGVEDQRPTEVAETAAEEPTEVIDPTTLQPCDLLTQDQAAGVLDDPGRGKLTSFIASNGEEYASCDYKSGDEYLGLSILQKEAGEALFERFTDAKSLKGIGDVAVRSTDLPIVYVLVGRVFFLVSASKLNVPTTDQFHQNADRQLPDIAADIARSIGG